MKQLGAGIDKVKDTPGIRVSPSPIVRDDQSNLAGDPMTPLLSAIAREATGFQSIRRHDEQPLSFQCCSLDTYILWCHRSLCRSGRDADPQRRPLAPTLGQNVLLVDHRRGGVTLYK